MSDRLKIPPTKSALLRIQGQVEFLEQGHTLLERKKELITRLVYDRLADYRKLRRQARKSLEEAYHWLSIAHMRMGSNRMRLQALGMPQAIKVNILPRSHLGVEYPSVQAEKLPLAPVGLAGTDSSLDEARSRLADMAVMLARLGEAEIALWRLLEEQRKTQKRVNALKYNVIPKYHNTIKYIESGLEEEERNTLFQIKVLREQERI
jgi:V/A-type H+-transporting ATPase subunit D